ncbi:MNNG and nitrosoguanidine resistance protein [Pseudomassariella vexata]|uniref:MNNG and nitrosoguanidine resistance protein n=1 Tax=Pseudomassariella vexata TaxID=1141098 RepID=A0A1Y2DLA0_9PEZI|nr:MNNG and nitrosoguanidine resistance protein [Pseudomassariella vexata]ORY60012.1 MNNG and nitrosoguanidine resistance protein [Pseudomassariella vexata]
MFGVDRGVHQNQPHQSVGFWHHQMSKVRAHVLLSWIKTVCILVVFVLAILSLYWAVLYGVEGRLGNLVVHVVDFDGQVAPYTNVQPVVGPLVTQLAMEKVEEVGQPCLGYTILPPSQFHNDPIAVRRAVYDWHSYAAIIVNPNATALLVEAVSTGNASYDPTGAVQIIMLSARDETTYYTYIIPQLQEFTKAFVTEFGSQWIQSLMSNTSTSNSVLARVPQAVNPGILPSMVDLRPFQPAQATPAVTIGLIYLIIVAFFSFAFFLPIHNNYINPQGHPPLHFYQLIIWRWLATMTAYFIISLVYSLVSLAFQVPFWPSPASPTSVALGATAYGRASFPVYWMLNFVGMCALGIACENVAMLVGQPWTALWLIFWVITNVSTSFYAIDLAPGFFKWGYAWPLHNIVEASRHILFDLHSRIGLNFGVLCAWTAVNTALFPLCCYFMRWANEREKRKEERDKDRYVVDTFEGKKEVRKREGEKPPIRKRGFLRGF